MMVDKVEAPDPQTVVFRLKFATVPLFRHWRMRSPSSIRPKAGEDPRWYEMNILGSGAFKDPVYETGQSISGVRNPDYYHPGKPYLDGFKAIFADKQATRVDALRSGRADIEFRGLPPARAMSSRVRSATASRCRKATGIAAA